MAVYTIGDLHLSVNGEKPMDIFSGWGNYTKKLEQNWCSQITETDTVVIVGDVSWAMTLEGARPDFDFIHRLPGKKIIIKGNHDFWWTTIKKMSQWSQSCGFDTVRFLYNNAYIAEGIGICGTRSWFYDTQECENDKVFARELGRLKASITTLEKADIEEKVAFLHYPPLYKNEVVKEIVSLLKEHNIHRCFYGHLHGRITKQAFNGVYDGIEFRLVSSDHLSFSPYRVI